MFKLAYTISFIALSFLLTAQKGFPQELSLPGFTFKNKAGVVEEYSTGKKEKKIFLFYDLKSEAWAELMYSGARFIFDKDASIFPIYFSGQLTKKSSKDFASDIPTQLYSTPLKSLFKSFNLTDADYPILVVYDEKNQLKGYARNTEDILKLAPDSR
jgi:hypothetical protein